MIPKVIHYCWFGHNPLPKLAKKCIASWKKYLPDYEIKEWNEDNFDVNIIPYTKQAYACKKYAFVSDFARFWILYNYGGVYFDTDVEVIKPMDEIIQKGPYMGCENYATQNSSLQVAPGLGMAAYKGMAIYEDILAYYNKKSFIVDGSPNLLTVVKIVTELLYSKGLKSVNEIQRIEGMVIYPADFFAARDRAFIQVPLTSNSYSIHHYMASWESPYIRFKKNIVRIIGKNWTNKIVSIKRIFCSLLKNR